MKDLATEGNRGLVPPFSPLVFLFFCFLLSVTPQYGWAQKVCFAVADDATVSTSGDDLLTRVDKFSTNNTEVRIGDGTGTSTLEAIAFQPNTNVLFAADASTLGTLSLITGLYSSIGSFGSGDGAQGNVSFDDVDGLAFDPFVSNDTTLYGSVRRTSGNADLLIRIAPSTGQAIPDAFGAGVDYVEIGTLDIGGGTVLDDIDDLAIDPTTGTLYGILNEAGSDDRLVTINKTTGAISSPKVLAVEDMEGLTMDPDGILWGTTGSAASPQAIYIIDPADGSVSTARPFQEGSDYEGGACFATPKIDLELSIVVDDATPAVGSTVTYTITLTNQGPNTATQVNVTDVLPAGLTYQSSSPSQGTYTSGTGIWDVGSVLVSTPLTLQITAQVTTPGTYNNTAEVSSTDPYEFDEDSIPGNNDATEDDQDSVSVEASLSACLNDVLLVVADAVPNAEDAARKTLIESWGYTVTTIEDADSQANFDAAVQTANVVYLSEEVASSLVGTKLTNARVGIVSEESAIIDELELATTHFSDTGQAMTITDASHAITSPFGTGSLTIFSSTQGVYGPSGTLATGLQLLAQWNGGNMLGVIDAGDATLSGQAAGRRVLLPWGTGAFDIAALNDDGKFLMLRSLVWAAQESDHDGDGIPDSVEDTDGDCTFTDDDMDNDGVSNYLDIDADNDGITDKTEAGVDPKNPDNTDSNGNADYLDIDADGDGIPDNVEAQSTAGYTEPSSTFTDIDNDGLDDVYDADTGSQDPVDSAGLTPYDHDGDGDADYLDTDSDDDGLPDATEGHDYNHDIIPDYTPTGSDSDNDGLDNGFEGEFGGSYTPGNTDNPNNGVSDTDTDLPNHGGGGSDVDFRNSAVLPVALVAFGAVADGPDVVLAWQTASETNNAGFEIQHRVGVETRPGASLPWEHLGFVDGYGTTEFAQSYAYRVEDLAPGRHVFRLKQINLDGTFEYHGAVEVVVEMVERFLIEPVYPNPFNPQAQFRFAVNRQQQVRVDLYDMRGRRVKVLYEGEPSKGQMHTVRIDGRGLPSGLYVVRLIGETFVETQTVMLLK